VVENYLAAKINLQRTPWVLVMMMVQLYCGHLIDPRSSDFRVVLARISQALKFSV